MARFFVFFMVLVAGQRLFALPVAAFGDLRGHVEPCGCDPRTDVGGVKRLATVISRYRASSPGLLVVDAGNSLLDLDAETPESTALARALEIIKPTASLLNQLEWSRLAHGTRCRREEHASIGAVRRVMFSRRRVCGRGASGWRS